MAKVELPTIGCASFEHLRLDSSKDQLRLIRLVRKDMSGILHCELKTWNLESVPSYLALSYMWGESGSTQPINVNGQRFEVRDNLFEFLRVYTDDESCEAWRSDSWLWIDQLCIDQSNVQEKNHQVRLMSKIYKGSLSVIVWLGRDPDLVEATENYATTGLSDSLKPLFHSPYFTRLWIVQEILLAPTLRVLCGRTWISLITMRKLAESCSWNQFPHVALSLFSEGATDFDQFDVPVIYDRSTADRRQTSLKVCIRRYSGNHCADPRDKLYGLFGLFEGLDLEPDYGKSVSEVFLDSMRIVAPGMGKFYYDEKIEVEAERTEFFSLATQLGQNMGLTERNLWDLDEKLEQIFNQRCINLDHPEGLMNQMLTHLQMGRTSRRISWPM